MIAKKILVIMLLVLIALAIAPLANAQIANNFTVVYAGRTYVNNATTFTYIVSGTGVPPDLSHFDIEIPHCPVALILIGCSPTQGVTLGVDPTKGVDGIKWDGQLLVNATRTYSITFEGNVVEGTTRAAVKNGNGFYTVDVLGPSCALPALDLEKYVSVDGSTWLDADSVPGPIVAPGDRCHSASWSPITEMLS
jgi:hypothetical protein